MGRLEPKHWILIAGFLAGAATIVAGLGSWSELFKPAIVAGLMLQLATHIGAIFAGAPQNPNLNQIVNPGRRETDPVPPAMGSVSDATRRNL